MPVFSALIRETHHNVSAGFIDMLIQTQREELFTGLMQLAYPADENLAFTFVDGVEQKLYRYRGDTTEIIPRPAWEQTLGPSAISVGFLRLALDAMRFIQVAHEAPVVRIEQSKLSSQEWSECARQWALDAAPSIVHVQLEQGDRWYLFADRSGSVLEELTLVDGKLQFSISNSSFPHGLPEGVHPVIRYISDREHDAWREYELRLSINPFVRMLMARFSELAGRVLTERLCEQLSAWARGGGWNITLSSNGVVNQQYFDSLDAAVNAYADILRRFQYEAGTAIGSRMAESISRDVLFKLDQNRRELLLRYIFTQNGIGGVAVRA